MRAAVCAPPTPPLPLLLPLLQLSEARSAREELMAELAALTNQVSGLQAEIDSRDEKMSGLEVAAEQANKGAGFVGGSGGLSKVLPGSFWLYAGQAKESLAWLWWFLTPFTWRFTIRAVLCTCDSCLCPSLQVWRCAQLSLYIYLLTRVYTHVPPNTPPSR